MMITFPDRRDRNVFANMLPVPTPNRIDRRLILSPGISGALNALPICDSRAGHLSNGL